MSSSLPAIDPATGEVFAETPITPVEEVAGVVARARAAQPAWAARTVAERARVLSRFQQVLYGRRRDMADLISRENGKPLGEALFADVAVTLDLVRYYLAHGERLLRPTPVRAGNLALLGKRGRVHWDPMGVLAVIAPWNYPLLLPAGTLLPGLLAGNAVVLKPSEFTTRTAVLLAELLAEAGVPEGLVAVVVGGGEVGAALIDAGPDKIFFTGSAATGRKVSLRAAEQMIPVNLELGGSDPCLVLADADLELAASGALWARFTNGGQTCVAVKRAIVVRPVYQRFVDLVVRKAEALVLGPGLSPATDVGPMIRDSQVRELERQLAQAVARGARVLTGGRRRPDLGPTFFEPTVVTELPLDTALWREEVFGPVLPIVVADDEEHAIRLANDSAYGLSASVWTRDRARGRRVARRLEAGAVQVNDATSHVGTAEVPHGGEKQSGLGRTHGEHGLRETCRPRYVGVDYLDWMHRPWWFGYHAESMGARDAFLRLAFAPSWLARLRAMPAALGLLRNRRRL